MCVAEYYILICLVRREKELAAVVISKDDVELIVSEMELDKKVAERKLREAGGDVVQALRTLVG
jgi:NACalpha-BTF3-like transcription factor